MSATMNQYDELFGNVKENNVAMPRCACVVCNSCTCGCSCRTVPDMDFDWEKL